MFRSTALSSRRQFLQTLYSPLSDFLLFGKYTVETNIRQNWMAGKMVIQCGSFPHRREVVRRVRAAGCLRLPQMGGICYNTPSNSVLVPGLETANYMFRNTVRLCAAMQNRGALLRRVLEQALSGASIQAGQSECAAFLFRARRCAYSRGCAEKKTG